MDRVTFADLMRKVDEINEAAKRLLEVTRELKEIVSKSRVK